MIAIARFEVPLAQAGQFRAQIERAQQVFSERDGYISGGFGQNLENNQIWSLVTIWQNVGSYRRALSALPVKMEVVPLLATAIDEPGAYSADL